MKKLFKSFFCLCISGMLLSVGICAFAISDNFDYSGENISAGDIHLGENETLSKDRIYIGEYKVTASTLNVRKGREKAIR